MFVNLPLAGKGALALKDLLRIAGLPLPTPRRAQSTWWAEENKYPVLPSPADIMKAPEAPQVQTSVLFHLVRRTETLHVDLALEALKGNFGVVF